MATNPTGQKGTYDFLRTVQVKPCKKVGGSQAWWWCRLVILAVRRQKQEDREFENSLGYIVILSQKNTNKQKARAS
jgi:hypothetical protein